MAARVRKIRHDENTRAKIQVAMILNRLQKLIAGEIEMPNSAVMAAQCLLRKVLPDVSSVTHVGDRDNPIRVHTIVTGVIRAAERAGAEPIDVTPTPASLPAPNARETA